MSTDLSRPLVQRRVNDKRTHSLLTLVVDDELGVLSRLITEEVANGVLADHMTRQELPRSGSAKGGDEPPCDSVKITRAHRGAYRVSRDHTIADAHPIDGSPGRWTSQAAHRRKPAGSTDTEASDADTSMSLDSSASSFSASEAVGRSITGGGAGSGGEISKWG